MNYQELYNKYYSRMVGEGVVKSVLCALTIGFAVGGVVALIAWFVGFSGLWISLGCIVGVTAAIAPVFYFRLFRPTEASVARRLDSLGFDERVITMQEFQGDNSDIASLQRRDAVAIVNQAERTAKASGSKLIRYKVPAKTIAATCAVGVFGVMMAIVIGLSDYGVIPGGRAVWGEVFPPHLEEYLVNYGTEGGATLTVGKENQLVQEGGATEEVLYTADRNFYFTFWIDDLGNVYFGGPSRHEENVIDDVEFKAYFKELEELEDDNDFDRDLPTNGGNNNSGGSSGPGGLGDDEFDSNQNNSIVDGNTDYREEYSKYYEEAMDYLKDNPNISPEARAIIEAYFKTLQ